MHSQEALSPTAFASRPSTSSALSVVEPVKNYVPDRPAIHYVRFRRDDQKPAKAIVVESNYDYVPKSRDELKLKRGSTIKVIRRDGEDGWWYGKTLDGSGKEGFFPLNYVQLAKTLFKEIDPKDVKFTGRLGAGGFSVVKSAIYKGRLFGKKPAFFKCWII
ncbi:unnamed protein product [Gongylonema pulchrum]|uniref:SH3 domain-containing protein n=1 Tax=Gongylonema pulchrum TaxID=637853 RepID=A0A183E3W0_9BILA|nr:unnamed protein product [Gongylonema pulchrum]